MRKLIAYIFIFVIICFLIPIVLTTVEEKTKMVDGKANTENINNTENNRQESDAEKKEPYDYREYSTIKLFRTETGEIQDINFEEYIYGVIAAEMPASFEVEALKAQAVVARTYTIYKAKNNKEKHGEAMVCDSYLCCQDWMSKEKRYEKWGDDLKKEEYWNKIVEAVNTTKGEVITYKGEVINALFHANSGGKTELPTNVWEGNNDYPYLQTVATSGEEGYTQYHSEVELSKEEIANKIKEKHPNLEIDWNTEKPIEILEYTEGRKNKNHSIWKYKFIWGRSEEHLYIKICKLYICNPF